MTDEDSETEDLDSDLDPNPSFAKAIAMMLEDVFVPEFADLPLCPFDKVCPTQAYQEEDYHILFEGEPAELSGSYGISDLYCQNPFCNCQKVTLIFFDDKGKAHATIAYGWKSKTFYCKWGLDPEASQWLTEGFLDPLGEQGPHADLFLDAFTYTLKGDPQFIAWLKRRYDLFKETILLDPSVVTPSPDVELPENVTPFPSYKSLKAS